MKNEVWFDNVRVPAENVVGEEGQDGPMRNSYFSMREVLLLELLK